MTTLRKFLLAVGSAAVLLLGAQSAFATSYTLSGPVLFSDGSGNQVLLTGVLSDVGTQVYLAGVAGADLFIFDVSVVTGSIEELDASLLIATAVGLGYYTDGDVAPSSGSLVAGSGQFDYDAPNLTSTGNRLFLSFNGFFLQGSAQFMAQAPGGLIFSGNGGIIDIALIPEPGTFALSALGLTALAAHRRRRRAS